jgi:hypothetical protein
MSRGSEGVSAVLTAMADGIGDLVFASPEWVKAAQAALQVAASRHAEKLEGLGRFTLCEVGMNPPTYLDAGSSLAWHVKFNDAKVEASVGELDDAECDFKLTGDHSILSNLARIQYEGRDPEVVAGAQKRLRKLSRWVIRGALPENRALGTVLRSLHDALAERTMPRFVFMSPEWVSSARHILSTRAGSAKYIDSLKDVDYTFSEEFTDTPKYAFPDGAPGGFWVRCDQGAMTVGAGPLPKELEPADFLTKGMYEPVIPVGRTVNAGMSKQAQDAVAAYSKVVFRYDKVAKRAPISQTSPSGKGMMPAGLARVFVPLHDEMSKRTSGERPADYASTTTTTTASMPRSATTSDASFDRGKDYDASWVRYDKVDIYGEKLEG